MGRRKILSTPIHSFVKFFSTFLKIEKQQNEIFYISCQRDKILNNVSLKKNLYKKKKNEKKEKK